MSRTSWVAPGQGESLQTLLAYTVQNASPEVGLRAAQWVAQNAAVYRSYATARTNLALELTGSRRTEDDHDHARVLAVLRDIDEEGPERFFGHDLVRAAVGAEVSMLDLGARQARALAAGIENVGRALDSARETLAAEHKAKEALAREATSLREQVNVLRRQLSEKGVELTAPPPSFRDSYVVVDGATGQLWDGKDWTSDPSRAVRFADPQVDDIVSLQQGLMDQGLRRAQQSGVYVVRSYGVDGRELWRELDLAGPAVDVAPPLPSFSESERSGRGMAALVDPLPVGLGLSR